MKKINILKVSNFNECIESINSLVKEINVLEYENKKLEKNVARISIENYCLTSNRDYYKEKLEELQEFINTILIDGGC